jgi:hypothetical protein
MKLSNGFTVKAFAGMGLAFALAGMHSAQAAAVTINNDTFWRDTSGSPIYSQGGGILKVGSTYYWYGAKYNGAVTYAANPAKANSDASFNAVTVYSSTDLATWKFEGNAITTSTAQNPSWLGRLGVVYNANTKKYVLISQYSSSTRSGVMFATSSSPAGPFTFDHIQPSIPNVSSAGTGDQTIYTDDTGLSYLVFSNAGGRQRSYVALVRASDSLNIEPATNVFTNSAGREGNAMFKHNGTYYLCASALHGWNASETYCRSAKVITGPYTAEFVLNGSQADFSHVSQNGFFVQVNGTRASSVIFAGDRWSDFAGNGVGYNQWLPISFSGTTPSVNSHTQWTLDAATGTWSVGAANNYVKNPGFEADRIAQNDLAGWTTWTSNTGGNPNSNVLNPHTGRWSARISHSAAFAASRYQVISDLPNGTYTLKAWVKSSGGQSVARVYVKNYGGPELTSELNTSISSWTQVTVPNIAVSNGTAQVGMYCVGIANNWLVVDDFTLIKNQE